MDHDRETAEFETIPPVGHPKVRYYGKRTFLKQNKAIGIKHLTCCLKTSTVSLKGKGIPLTSYYNKRSLSLVAI